MDGLWDEAGVCFDTDDGSLPGIEVAKLSPAGVSAVYAMLRRTAATAGEAESFHHCVEGLVAGGVELPVLGVFVWPEGVELDYRMGREWGPAQVAGVFELLRDCCALDPAAAVVLGECEGPPYPDRFLRAWSSYKRHAEPGAAADPAS